MVIEIMTELLALLVLVAIIAFIEGVFKNKKPKPHSNLSVGNKKKILTPHK